MCFGRAADINAAGRVGVAFVNKSISSARFGAPSTGPLGEPDDGLHDVCEVVGDVG